MSNVTYLNSEFHRTKEALIGSICTFVTSAGIFNGVISNIYEDNAIYELQDVTFRPISNIQTQIKMKICEVITSHIVASLPNIEE